jgi:RNA recognition motif-containing protein
LDDPEIAGRKEPDVVGTRLYVGNLPFDTDASQLRTLFQEGGRQVTDVKIITDRDTGRSRGFAFVEMGSQEDADGAVNALNGREFGGRALTVNEAREQAPRRGGGGGGFGGGGGYGGGGGRGGRRGY